MSCPPGKTPWAGSPWSGDIRDGRLHGRGSFDMKGGLAAAFGVACALRRAGIRTGGDLVCESVVDEEWGGGGGTLAARLRGDRADACAITEGTQLEIALATRGGATVDLCVSAGDPERFFSSAEVVSPAIPLGRLLGWLDEWAARRRRIPRGRHYAAFEDPAPVQVLAIEANRLDLTEPLAVPLAATVRAYFQFLPHEDVDAVLAEIRRSLDAFCERDPFFRAHRPEWRELYSPPLLGHELAPNHPWAECMAAAARAALGREPVVAAAPYPCDAFLAHREFGIPTLLFGPRGGGAHNPGEYVEIASVLDTARTLLAAALVWCGD
jgi:acetylornithine deacetylase